MNDSEECCSDLQTSVSFPKHFLTTFSSDSSASGKYVEIDLDVTDDSIPISLGKKVKQIEFISCNKEDSLLKSHGTGRKRNFIDLSGEDTLEDGESDVEHVECTMPKTRRLSDSIDNFTAADSGFPIFPIDNCLKSVQTPYCIVFPSISLSTCSESTRDGERQMVFSNIQNLSQEECVNELRSTFHISNNPASTARFTNDVLDISNKYEYIDAENIRNDSENSNGSERHSVSDFIPSHTESYSPLERLPVDDSPDLKASVGSSQERASPVVDINAVNTSSSLSTVNTDTLMTVSSETGSQQRETSTTLSGGIVGTQVIYNPHPRTGQLVFAENLSFQSSSLLQPKYSLLSNSQNRMSFTPSMMVKPQLVSVNSSGEDTSGEISSKTPPAAHTNAQEEGLLPHCLISSPKQRSSSAESSYDEVHGRESHNIKERKRRARIKEACDLMRFLVPGMTDKTDKATVFEFGARYIHFLKSYVGSSNDKDFLIKYSPYY
ncbi:uncharacterized protein LOC121381845 [Gigantopelta aegis]|uniref:uncharacterized protein LOC121381845 n=1 Tax=Gigantopelta aegis TaxID=1735272 RepID=UPI001B88AFDF|nr:uncharacterized protein LOC121381845 [Gigantopelta aegis]